MFSIIKETFNIMTVVVEPLRQCHLSRVWKFYGDSEDGEFAHCLLCKYNPNKGVDVAIKVNILCFCLLTFCKCHLFDYSIINDQVGGASGGSTHGLRNHLKNFHQKEFLDMQHEKEKEEKTKKKHCQRHNGPEG